MTEDEKQGYRTVEGVLDHIEADALMLLATLPAGGRHPVMAALGAMLASTRHARRAMEAHGQHDPELNALCEQVALMVVGPLNRGSDVPAAFRRAFEQD
jgi:hypothetical protein